MKTLYISTSQDKITQQAIDESSTALIPSNSLLMVIRSGILKSKLPLAINKVDVTINQDMKAFSSEIVNTEYLLYFFFAEERNILKKVKGTTADNLNFEDVKNLKIKIPPLELQTKFAQIVEKTEALKAQYQQSLQELENLFGSLSQKAFKGELNLKDESLLMAAEPKASYK
jgi:type I restriction enzyme S subunit